jgi:hypothetical protein
MTRTASYALIGKVLSYIATLNHVPHAHGSCLVPIAYANLTRWAWVNVRNQHTVHCLCGQRLRHHT